MIQCRALRCRRLNVNHTGNLGNHWARPPGRRRLVDRWRTRSHKSSQIHRWYTESCAGIMYRAKQTVVDCGTCELSFSPLCPSLPDFRADRFILQLLSNRLACVCLSASVCCRAGGEDVGERKEFKSSTLSLSLSLFQKCGWMLNISALSSSLSQYCGGCCCFRHPVQYDTDGELVKMPTTTPWYVLGWKRRLREK